MKSIDNRIIFLNQIDLVEFQGRTNTRMHNQIIHYFAFKVCVYFKKNEKTINLIKRSPRIDVKIQSMFSISPILAYYTRLS